MSQKWTSHRRPPVRKTPKHVEDRTGLRRGSLVVLGYWGSTPGKPSKWTVRCDCGAYEVRTGRSLRRLNMDDKCGFCRSDEIKFKRRFYEANGRYPEFFEMPKPQRRAAA